LLEVTAQEEAAMPYSDFTLLSVEHTFELRRTEVPRLFLDVPPCLPTSKLEETLAEGIPLAIAMNTEKARSELLIMPVLLDVRRHFPGQASLFSGVLFDVDPVRGLTGYADFLLSRHASQLVLTAPVAVVVEAKNDNLLSGLGQCLATMVAARCFNTRAQTGVTRVLGAVTTGTRWQFLRLDGNDVAIELHEYSLERDVAQILGILASSLA
jgi:hypothetical protein